MASKLDDPTHVFPKLSWGHCRRQSLLHGASCRGLKQVLICSHTRLLQSKMQQKQQICHGIMAATELYRRAALLWSWPPSGMAHPGLSRSEGRGPAGREGGREEMTGAED